MQEDEHIALKTEPPRRKSTAAGRKQNRERVAAFRARQKELLSEEASEAELTPEQRMLRKDCDVMTALLLAGLQYLKPEKNKPSRIQSIEDFNEVARSIEKFDAEHTQADQYLNAWGLSKRCGLVDDFQKFYAAFQASPTQEIQETREV